MGKEISLKISITPYSKYSQHEQSYCGANRKTLRELS